MAKLHELLAVETSIRHSYSRDKEESLKVFGRPVAFQKTVKEKKFFNAEDSKLDTTEIVEMTTSAKARLQWFAGHVRKVFDVIVQKDKTNQVAVADIIIDDKVLVAAVPATTLLALEKELNELRTVFEAVPTLPSTISWEPEDAEFDAAKSKSFKCRRAKEQTVTYQTKKVTKPVVLYEATKEHPAQVKEVSEDIPVAKIVTTQWNSMLEAGEKAQLLGNLDSLLQAVKKARQRANAVDVVKAEIGKPIFEYLYNGVV